MNSQRTTKPIANRAISAVTIGLIVFAKTTKSFDLAFKKMKVKKK